MFGCYREKLHVNHFQSCRVYFCLSGSGASCIYALLGAKINNWHFLATEVDELSVSFAKENVKCNGLEGNIEGRTKYCIYRYDIWYDISCVSKQSLHGLAFAWKFFNLFSARKVNPLTPRSDWHVTSPNSIHALSNNQVVRLAQLIKYKILSWLKTKFS